MRGMFVAGTDTGVGKTVITGLLGHYLLNRGYNVITQKWVQTGVRGYSSDVNLHLKLMNRQKKDIKDYLPYVSPYIFNFASSPHLAARLEGKRIMAARLKQSFRFLSKQFDFVIVEGAGGLLVPLDKKTLLVDIVKKLDLPLLVVAANKLGAINHTLLTIEAIKKRGVKIIGIIFNNNSKGINKLILDDNTQIIKELTRETVLGTLPYIEHKKRLYNSFIPIGKQFLASLKRR